VIEFGTNYGGAEEVTLGNDQQAIPFKFHLTIPLEDSEGGTFNFDFTEADANFFSMLRSSEFTTAVSQGGSLIIREYSTGRRLLAFSVCPNASRKPGDGFLELLRKLVWIQQQLDTEIVPPNRDIFESCDIEEILSVEAILRTGRFRGNCTSFNTAFKAGTLNDLITKHPEGISGEVRIVQEYRQKLLGTEVTLGLVDVSCKRAKFEPDLRSLAARLDSEGSLSARLIPEEGAFDVKFRNWPKPEADEVKPPTEDG
jgi:hypothetical protein